MVKDYGDSKNLLIVLCILVHNISRLARTHESTPSSVCVCLCIYRHVYCGLTAAFYDCAAPVTVPLQNLQQISLSALSLFAPELKFLINTNQVGLHADLAPHYYATPYP